MFSIRLNNDDTQDFDLRWEQAIFSISNPPADQILGSLYKSKSQDSLQLQTVLSLYNQDLIRRGGEPDYNRLRLCVKLHIDDTLRNKNFKIQNEMVERGVTSKSHKEEKNFGGRKSRRMLSVESKWIMFKRRVL